MNLSLDGASVVEVVVVDLYSSGFLCVVAISTSVVESCGDGRVSLCFLLESPDVFVGVESDVFGERGRLTDELVEIIDSFMGFSGAMGSVWKSLSAIDVLDGLESLDDTESGRTDVSDCESFSAWSEVDGEYLVSAFLSG